MHQRTIRELMNIPNIIPTETDEERKARLAIQHIGSSKGTHPKVLAAQEASRKQFQLRHRHKAKKETKS